MRRSRLSRIWPAGVMAVLFGAMFIAGCGGGDDSSNGTAEATGTSTSEESGSGSFTGSPIKLGTAAPIGSPIADYPGIFAAASAAVTGINSEGGVNGRELQLVTCNTQGEPQQEVACANKFAGAGVSATIGDIVFADTGGYLAALERGDIVQLGAMALDENGYTKPNTYPLDFFSGAYAPCATPEVTEKAGGNKIGAAVSEITTSQINKKFMETSSKNTGTDWVGSVAAPTTTADYGPLVQQLAELEPETVAIATPGPGVIGFISASAGSGQEWSWCVPEGWANGAKPLIDLGGAVEEFYSPITIPPLSAASEFPELDRFIEEMKAEEEAGTEGASTDPADFGAPTLRAWLAGRAFKQIAEQISEEITPEAVSKGIDGTTVDLEVFPPIDFSKPVGAGEFPRVFNPILLLQKWDTGKQDYTFESGIEWNGIELIYGK